MTIIFSTCIITFSLVPTLTLAEPISPIYNSKATYTLNSNQAPELKFITGSAELDYTPLPNASIISGITLDTLEVSITKTLLLKLLILEQAKSNIETTAHVAYNYTLLDHIPYK